MLGVVAAAMRLADRRERAVMAAVTLLRSRSRCSLGGVDRYTDFDLQGREILPVLMLIPLLAGELVARHRQEVLKLPWRAWRAWRPAGRSP